MRPDRRCECKDCRCPLYVFEESGERVCTYCRQGEHGEIRKPQEAGSDTLHWPLYQKRTPTRAALITTFRDMPMGAWQVRMSEHGETQEVEVITAEGALWVALPFYLAIDSRGYFYPIDPGVFKTTYVPADPPMLMVTVEDGQIGDVKTLECAQCGQHEPISQAQLDPRRGLGLGVSAGEETCPLRSGNEPHRFMRHWKGSDIIKAPCHFCGWCPVTKKHHPTNENLDLEEEE